MYIVDTHQHFQDVHSHHYPWLCDPADTALEGNIDPIRNNYLVDDYLNDVAPYPVTKTVHVENGWDRKSAVSETHWLNSLHEKTGYPTAAVAFVDLSSPEAERIIDNHCSFQIMRGIRENLAWHPWPGLSSAKRDLMLSQQWREGFAVLARRDLSFDLQIFSHQADDAFELAKDFDQTMIVVTHLGLPIDRSPEGLKEWESSLRKLSIADNVFLKLSGLGLGSPEWTINNTLPLLLRAVEIFGSSRCMIGSNLPVERLFSNGQAPFDCFSALSYHLGPNEISDIMHRTAEAFYRI